MKLVTSFGVLLLSVININTANAGSEDRQCARNANTTERLCSKECSSNREDSLLVCAAGTNQTLASCYKSCSTDKDTCLRPFQDTLKGCSDTCFATINAALTACETGDCLAGILQCRICKLTAKLARFECASTCATAFEASKINRQVCRLTFRECLKTCKKA